MIFRSGIVRDAATLKKFRSVCDTSEYAASLVDKAILAHRNKANAVTQDPMIEIAKDDDDAQAAADLVQKLLQVLPDTRVTADQAIRHPFVAKFYNPTIEERVRKREILPPLDENVQLSIDEYRQKLYEIIQSDKARCQLNREA